MKTNGNTKSLASYIHLYIGCEIVIPSIDEELENWEGYTLSGVCFKEATIYHSEHGISQFHVDDIKLLLRPLSDMTEEEDQAFMLANRNHWIDMHWYPEGFLWLLSRGFDLFGLIEAGLAINAKDTQNKTN